MCVCSLKTERPTLEMHSSKKRSWTSKTNSIPFHVFQGQVTAHEGHLRSLCAELDKKKVSLSIIQYYPVSFIHRRVILSRHFSSQLFLAVKTASLWCVQFDRTNWFNKTKRYISRWSSQVGTLSVSAASAILCIPFRFYSNTRIQIVL